MRRCFAALCWASAMLLLATAARAHWIERDSADLLLMILPLVAFTCLTLGRDRCSISREA